MNLPSELPPVLSPAKINIGLSVLCRRPDNYHEIESLFMAIDFADRLAIRHSQNTQLHTENQIAVASRADFDKVSERGNPQNNLLLKIIRSVNHDRLQNHPKLPPVQADLFLSKQIPSGAGLGGGSSNAAVLINWLINEGIVSKQAGFELAKRHGADIPFFLNPMPSVVTGIGDTIQPLSVSESQRKRLLSIKGLLILSDILVETKNAYIDLKRPLQEAAQSKSGPSPRRAFEALLDGDAKILSQVINDFESVVFARHSGLAGIKDTLLSSGAFFASMSGSGSAMFGLFEGPSFDRAKDAIRSRSADTTIVPFGFFL